MPDQPPIDTPEKAFISRELRPDVTIEEEGATPLAPDAPHSELRRRAAETLGPSLCERLGLGDPAAPLAPGDVCSRRPDVVWSAVDGEAVLLDLASGFYFSLNRVGAVIWELFDGERTLGAVQEAVCGRFEASPETVWADLEALVRRLCADKLATMGVASRE
jgi:hypothetical protein